MSKIIDFKTKKEKQKQKATTLEGGTLYEANQAIMQTRKVLTPLEISALYPKLEEWFNMAIDSYAMLLCHDRRDYTIFHLYEKQNPNPPALAVKELFGCLTNRGKILSVDPTPNKAWEIWLKIDEQAFCYYLFRYDEAVIEV